MQDLEDMLGFRPYSFYFYMWRYVSPAILVVLIVATVIEMAVSPAGYNAWVESEVRTLKDFTLILTFLWQMDGFSKSSAFTSHIHLLKSL